MSFNLFDLLHYQALMTRLLETDSWGRAAYYLSNRWPQQSPAAQTGGQQPARENCSCRIREQCPLDGKCLKSAVIYQAAVTANDNMHQETYIGLTETSFKTRYLLDLLLAEKILKRLIDYIKIVFLNIFFKIEM